MVVQYITGQVWEDHAAIFLARIVGNLGMPITQASISTITGKVFDACDGTLVLNIGSIAITTIQNALVTNDPRWTKDITGYNWIYVIPGTAFPTGNRRYQCEFVFTPVSGDAFPVVYYPDALAIFTS